MRTGDRTFEDVRLVVEGLFPKRRVTSVKPLAGGLINTNLKIDFSSGAPAVVFRIYRDGAAVCSKEVGLLKLVGGAVPVPRILHARPEGIGPLGAFAVLDYVEGITFQQLTRTGNVAAINQAADSVGATLASIGRFRFPKPGRLQTNESGDLEVGDAYTHTPDPISEILEQFLAHSILITRLNARVIDDLRNFARRWAPFMPNIQDERQLVHSDFGNRNILVREEQGRWAVAAVLDWEFAFSGSPLLDVGHFLRYERRNIPLREPSFSRAFVRFGGKLPDNWRQIARVIDLTGLVQCLTHKDLPDDVEAEIIELINATLEDRDPAEDRSTQ